VSSVSLHQFLVLYTWFPLAALLLFLLLIARFYEKFSGIRTYFWLYTLPLAGLGVVAVRYAGIPVVFDDTLAALLSFISGVVLLFLSMHLYRVMLAKKP
jgi:hypothetical protein